MNNKILFQITKAGQQALLSAANSNAVVAITAMAIGNGVNNAGYSGSREQTMLRGEFQRTPISFEMAGLPDVTATFSGAPVGDIFEVGLFQGSTLIALWARTEKLTTKTLNSPITINGAFKDDNAATPGNELLEFTIGKTPYIDISGAPYNVIGDYNQGTNAGATNAQIISAIGESSALKRTSIDTNLGQDLTFTLQLASPSDTARLSGAVINASHAP